MTQEGTKKSGGTLDYETRRKWERLCARAEIEEDYDKFLSVRELIEEMLRVRADELSRRRASLRSAPSLKKFRWET